jgi:hypothetical protein
MGNGLWSGLALRCDLMILYHEPRHLSSIFTQQRHPHAILAQKGALSMGERALNFMMDGWFKPSPSFFP